VVSYGSLVIKGKDTQHMAGYEGMEFAVVVDDSGFYHRFGSRKEAVEFSEPYCQSEVGDGEGDMNVLIVPIGHPILEALGVKEASK
jgi:hypothetical protein